MFCTFLDPFLAGFVSTNLAFCLPLNNALLAFQTLNKYVGNVLLVVFK